MIRFVAFFLLLALCVVSVRTVNDDPYSHGSDAHHRSSKAPHGLHNGRKSSISISGELLNRAITHAVDSVDRSVKGIRRLAYLAKATLEPNSEDYRYARLHEATNETAKIAKFSLIAEKVSKQLVEYEKIKPSDLTLVDLYGTYLFDGCPYDYDHYCTHSSFRSINGTCNNLEHKFWGSSYVAHRRLLDPDYSDDVGQPREYGKFDKLPNSRDVSDTLRSILAHSEPIKHRYVSKVLVAFAGFVFTDISHVPRSAGYEGHHIKCCDISSEQKDHECFPALPTKADEHCLEYTRSSAAPNDHCLLGRRQQINQATAYLDASLVYGDTDEQLEKIRDPHSAKINFAAVSQIPVSKDVLMIAELFVWEHNRIADKLSELNHNWDYERAFQEARKIVIAMLQYITYEELLPILLGPKVMRDFDLKLAKKDYIYAYDSRDPPGVPNAAGVIMNALTLLSEVDLGAKDKFEFVDMTKDHAVNNPYASPKPKYAMKKEIFDGLAIAIQQARDHGLAGYQDFRRYCNLTIHERHSGYDEIIDKDVLVKLIKLYGKVEDLELIVAGLTEEPNYGSLLGPTFSCILGLTFSRIRRGDRFWFENDIPHSRFDPYQLIEIRKATLSKLLCLHTKIPTVQPNALLVPDYFRNAPIKCSSKYINHINISKFQSDTFSDKVLSETLDDLFSKALRRPPHLYKDYVSGQSSGIRVHNSFLKPTNNSLHKNSQAHKLEEVTWEFIKTHKDDQKEGLLHLLSFVDVDKYLNKLHFPSHLSRCLMEDWRRDTPCDYTCPYRTYSGRCNNMYFPEYGMTSQVYGRLLPATYDDYYKAPRTYSVVDHKIALPSARLVSNEIHHDTRLKNKRFTLMLMQFGQFIDHDLGHTPVTTGEHYEVLDCTKCKSNETVSEECYPIPIPPHDPFFPARHSITDEPACMAFTRSMAGQDRLGPRHQLNQVTSYLDLSLVYGSDECKARELRSYRRGLLRTDPHSRIGKEFLPRTKDDDECNAKSARCFLAGDSRTNEQPGLGVMHTVFMRLHNNIARTLRHYNKHWKDEKLFQETRKIVIAMYQRIVYNEFLPSILGEHAINRFDLKLKDDHYFDDYDKYCDATITNEFAIVAFRFGHSLIKASLPKYGKRGPGYKYRHSHQGKEYDEGYRQRTRGEKLGSVHLRDHFFKPDILIKGDTLIELLRGLVTEEAEAVDHSLSVEVTNHLFEDKNMKFSGLDLAALNIQRGRDHGIPGYINYLDDYYYKDVKRFADLRKIFSKDLIHKLKELYKNVEDIDLFTAGLLEKPLPGGLIGATFGKIIGQQFRDLRLCDKYWHESSDYRVRFTEDQLCEIRKMTLSKLLCDATYDIDELQVYAMEIDDYFRNPVLKCDDMDRIDYSKWREIKFCNVAGVKIPLERSAPASPCTHCTCTTDGPLCSSVKVKNCHFLAELYGSKAVKDDQMCAAQCPWHLLSGKHQNYKGDYYELDKYSDDYSDDEYDHDRENKFGHSGSLKTQSHERYGNFGGRKPHDPKSSRDSKAHGIYENVDAHKPVGKPHDKRPVRGPKHSSTSGKLGDLAYQSDEPQRQTTHKSYGKYDDFGYKNRVPSQRHEFTSNRHVGQSFSGKFGHDNSNIHRSNLDYRRGQDLHPRKSYYEGLDEDIHHFNTRPSDSTRKLHGTVHRPSQDSFNHRITTQGSSGYGDGHKLQRGGSLGYGDLDDDIHHFNTRPSDSTRKSHGTVHRPSQDSFNHRITAQGSSGHGDGHKLPRGGSLGFGSHRPGQSNVHHGRQDFRSDHRNV